MDCSTKGSIRLLFGSGMIPERAHNWNFLLKAYLAVRICCLLKGDLDGTSQYSLHRLGHLSIWDPKTQAGKDIRGIQSTGWEAMAARILGGSHGNSNICNVIIPESSNCTETGIVSIEEESRHQKQNVGQRTWSSPQTDKLKFRTGLPPQWRKEGPWS